VAILVTSTARLRELRHRPRGGGHATPCPGIDHELAQASTRWTVDGGPDGAVTRGCDAADRFASSSSRR
jgi:hypothetical protein